MQASEGCTKYMALQKKKERKESEENMTYCCLNGKRGLMQGECQKTQLWCKMMKGGTLGHKKSKLQW
jgi:hypothetical protein